MTIPFQFVLSLLGRTLDQLRPISIRAKHETSNSFKWPNCWNLWLSYDLPLFAWKVSWLGPISLELKKPKSSLKLVRTELTRNKFVSTEFDSELLVLFLFEDGSFWGCRIPRRSTPKRHTLVLVNGMKRLETKLELNKSKKYSKSQQLWMNFCIKESSWECFIFIVCLNDDVAVT